MLTQRKVIQTLLITFLLHTSLIGQIQLIDRDTILDERDHNKYEIIEVGDWLWFTEDLRFETAYAYPLLQDDQLVRYFYSNRQLDALCPAPFRIPTAMEWEIAITALYGIKEVTHQYIKYKKKKASIIKFNMDDTLLGNYQLKLVHTGWVEGGKYIEWASPTYWINEKDKTNYHLHFYPDENAFLEHTHKHNIEKGKEKKRRQFLVRCICKKEDIKAQKRKID